MATVIPLNLQAAICEAIRTRSVLEFDYQGRHRVVAPYCHGTSTRGGDVLRGVQLGGSSRSGGLGVGKLWLIAEITNVRASGERFEADDPHYDGNDVAMVRIHCRA